METIELSDLLYDGESHFDPIEELRLLDELMLQELEAIEATMELNFDNT